MFLGPLGIVITEGNPKVQRAQRRGERERAGEFRQDDKLVPAELSRLHRNTLLRIELNPII